jgi:hypothetical protein
MDKKEANLNKLQITSEGSTKMRNWLMGIVLSGIAVLAPIKPMLMTAMILLLIDLITGIWAALKRQEKIESAKLGRSITKFFLYNLAIITGFLMETYMSIDFIPLVKISCALIALTEGKSIFENISSITGVNFLDKLKSHLNKKD